MTKALSAVVNETLLNRFSGVATGGQNLAKALTGKSDSPAAQLQSGLRLGARTYASGVQNLNNLITVVNIAQSTLGNLGELTDRLIDITSQAASPAVGSQKRADLMVEFKTLGNKFKRIVEESKFGDDQLLSLEGLSAIFTKFGLDQEQSDGIAALFQEFVVPESLRQVSVDGELEEQTTPDDHLASDMIKGEQPAPIPASAYRIPKVVSRVTARYDELFGGEADISTRPNAYKVLNDLKALKGQIDDNVKVMDEASLLIGKNLDLVRAAGFAFLDLSEQIKTEMEADDVAQELRDRIRNDAPGALSQAENLEAIAVAALALNTDKGES